MNVQKINVNNQENEIEHPVETVDSTVDFSISDDKSHTILKLQSGNIITKSFDSNDFSDIKYNTSEQDFEIGDDNDHIIFKLNEGDIITKNFDSSKILTDVENLKTIINTQTQSQNYFINKFTGKTLGIIGDSISTFDGWLPDDKEGYTGDSYRPYYPTGQVTSVEQMYWYKTAKTLFGKCDNTNTVVCAMGSSGVMGDATSTTNPHCAASNKRISDLSSNGFNPDIIVCFIGCNNMGADAAIGNWKPQDGIPESTSTFREGYALMLYKLQTTYTNARIFCCTFLEETSWREKTPGWPTNTDTNKITKQYNDSIREIAHAFGCEIIEFATAGINYFTSSLYQQDGIHPNVAGQALLANRLISDLMIKY